MKRRPAPERDPGAEPVKPSPPAPGPIPEPVVRYPTRPLRAVETAPLQPEPRPEPERPLLPAVAPPGSSPVRALPLPESVEAWQRELERLEQFEDLIDQPSVADDLALFMAEILHCRAGQLLDEIRHRGELPGQLMSDLMDIYQDAAGFLEGYQAEDCAAELDEEVEESVFTYDTVPNIPGLPGAPPRVDGRRPDLIPGINDPSLPPRAQVHLASLANSLVG